MTDAAPSCAFPAALTDVSPADDTVVPSERVTEEPGPGGMGDGEADGTGTGIGEGDMAGAGDETGASAGGTVSVVVVV